MTKENQIQITINLPHFVYGQIEEQCHREGISISDYFLELHLEDIEAAREAEKMIKAKNKINSEKSESQPVVDSDKKKRLK